MRMFTLERWGSFGCQVWGDLYCSIQPKNGSYTFKYHAEVHAEDVDERGFLLDQNDLANMFASMKRTNLSCELLADHFVALIRSSVPHVRKVRVCIQPPPYVSKIVATWEIPR